MLIPIWSMEKHFQCRQDVHKHSIWMEFIFYTTNKNIALNLIWLTFMLYELWHIRWTHTQHTTASYTVRCKIWGEKCACKCLTHQYLSVHLSRGWTNLIYLIFVLRTEKKNGMKIVSMCEILLFSSTFFFEHM